jgi:hypothetical protein
VPAKVAGAELIKDEPGDFNRDGYNESEGCHVLKGPGPLSLTYERGAGAGFAPAFQVIGWKGDAPRTVRVNGREVEAAAGVADGRLVLQVLGIVEGAAVAVEIGK